jgi:hypothetical protein
VEAASAPSRPSRSQANARVGISTESYGRRHADLESHITIENPRLQRNDRPGQVSASAG